MPISPAAMRRVMREISDLEKSPPEGIRIQTSDEDMLDVTGIIEGPEGTPYAGGYFRVKFKFTEEFPAAPPKCWFATKIFHPNVGPTGEICVNTLKKDWKSTYGISHILVTVKCLLIYPNPESALDEEAGKLLLEEYQSYCDRAKLITSIHATPRRKPVEFETPSVVQQEVEDDAPSSSKDVSPAPSVPSTSSSSTTSTTPSLSKIASPTPPSASPSLTSSLSSNAPATHLPTLTRKSSPTPQIFMKTLPGEKQGSGLNPKERHASPSPLATADANVGVGSKPSMGVGLGMASAAGMEGRMGAKSMKRAATGSATSGAEKRKKALKRL